VCLVLIIRNVIITELRNGFAWICIIFFLRGIDTRVSYFKKKTFVSTSVFVDFPSLEATESISEIHVNEFMYE
jgi:hypothetical protein